MKKRGFTLIESLMAIVVFVLAMVALMGFISMSYKAYGYTKEQSIAINEARKGIETMVKEIRQAKQGDNGAYAIEKADDKEFIFYSNIDSDNETERVRYFLGTVSSGTSVKECVSFSRGGSCQVSFSDFLTGTLKSAQVQISVEGDFGAGNEYANVILDGKDLSPFCSSQCSDCAGIWQGTNTFDIRDDAVDNLLQFSISASSRVDPNCNWQEPGHSMKARFELSWTEDIANQNHQFKKGVTKPIGSPPSYPEDQEEITVLSFYVRNAPPIFQYFDTDNQEITILPARLKDTKLMKVYLVINSNPERPPQDFSLESFVQLRNLKTSQVEEIGLPQSQ
ncbi:type II secretion system GspH family protein [Candidatus Parcubacteria bacterium]|nr:type II secretion system GspH family protein [Patescibacteria group bacterium]MBU4466753.1 type II secretion system GspH family protein [Patescibacteria group bacterium]MCG2688512.1 type II secretion system GspH family protein [Candidatus Parcubacteria bacterium]